MISAPSGFSDPAVARIFNPEANALFFPSSFLLASSLSMLSSVVKGTLKPYLNKWEEIALKYYFGESEKSPVMNTT